jgi:hypothetical protein
MLLLDVIHETQAEHLEVVVFPALFATLMPLPKQWQSAQ